MTTYIPLLVFICIGGLFFLLAIVLIAIFIWVLKRNADVWQAAGKALQGDAKSYLAEQGRVLLPWNENALSDFSANLEINGQQVFNKLRYRGRFKSLSQPDESGWLAFDLNLTTGKGALLAQTAGRNFMLTVNGGLLQELTAEVRVDGILLGQIRVQGQLIFLLGVGARPLGQYNHPSREWRLSAQTSIYYLRPGYFDPTYSPVEIHGHQAAEFNSNLILSQHLKYLKEPIPALFRNLTLDLTSEEQDWLVTLAVFESYLRIARHLSEKQN
ncbi:MAG: hypothetical protein MUO77_07985 [Anaerolineales bacterium]|nr:hypothetical protein [Anaerolineales bacterium]